MRNLFVAIVIALSAMSCQSFHESPHRAVYINYQASDLSGDEFDGFGRGNTIEVGSWYGGSKGAERPTGVVGDIALRLGRTKDSVAGSDVTIDQIGLRAGALYYFDVRRAPVRPFVGAALVGQHTDVEASGLLMGGEADDFDVGGRFSIGIDIPITKGSAITIGYAVTDSIDGTTDAGSTFDLSERGVFIGWTVSL